MPAPENPARSSPVKHGDVIIGKSLNEIIGNFHSEINTEIGTGHTLRENANGAV